MAHEAATAAVLADTAAAQVEAIAVVLADIAAAAVEAIAVVLADIAVEVEVSTAEADSVVGAVDSTAAVVVADTTNRQSSQLKLQQQPAISRLLLFEGRLPVDTERDAQALDKAVEFIGCGRGRPHVMEP
jgi:hypothetical protein